MLRAGREFWTSTVAEFEQSGLTQDTFATRRGLSLPTLRSWIYKLRRERKASVSLIPVRVIASSARTARETEARHGLIEIELKSGVRIRVSSGADSEFVADLVQRLG